MMTMQSPPLHPRRFAKMQQGLSLPAVLMFLLVISLLATIGVRRATQNEVTVRNQLDYEVARQAAEAALRDGERDLYLLAGMQAEAICDRGASRPIRSDTTSAEFFTETCLNGQCMGDVNAYATSDFTNATSPAQPWWPVAQGGKWVVGLTAGQDNQATGAASKPPTGSCATFSGGVPLGTYTGTPKLAGVAQQPEYLIEHLRRGDDTRFRITARGFGADLRTEVVVQGVFAINAPANP
jgi:type IV pilus assembly protein PilX